MKNISIFEIIFTLFAFFAWSRAILRYRESKISNKDLLLWTAIWFGMVTIISIPGKADYIARVFGVRNGAEFMFFIAISILFYSVYRLYVKANEAERQITNLVRQLALQGRKKNKLP